MTKDYIRETILSKRVSIDSKTHQALSLKAVELIRNHPLYIQSKTIGIYHPIKSELDLTSLIVDDKHFALPRVVREDLVYDLYDSETTLKESHLKIYESSDHTPLDQKLDLIIVPALAVDKHNHRCGYGKGYFDRFIKENKHIKTLCVVLDFQVVEEIDIHDGDQAIYDIIVVGTEV